MCAMPPYQKTPKFPSMGEEPPKVPHCASERLLRGGNAYMTWWDCSHCFNRVVELSTKTGLFQYFAVPACEISPAYDPLKDVPKPSVSVRKEARAQTPPLSKDQWRKPKEQKALSREQEEVLRQAREILREAQRPTLTPTPTPRGTSSSSAGAPTFLNTTPKAPPQKRAPPRDEDEMSQSGGYEFVKDTDADLLLQISALEEITARLKASLRS
jgi:hypothetical protein